MGVVLAEVGSQDELEEASQRENVTLLRRPVCQEVLGDVVDACWAWQRSLAPFVHHLGLCKHHQCCQYTVTFSVIISFSTALTLLIVSVSVPITSITQHLSLYSHPSVLPVYRSFHCHYLFYHSSGFIITVTTVINHLYLHHYTVKLIYYA